MTFKLKHIIFLLLLLACNMELAAQEGQAKQLLEKARGQMAKGDYVSADLTFRRILSLNEVLPPEALYFFAYTLDQTHQLQSSKNFLAKYFELTGKSGEYYNEARILESKLLKKSTEIEACGFCDSDGFRLATCPVCDGAGKIDGKCSVCHGFGQVTCQKCLGEGVQISKNSFNDNVYKTCDVCGGTGKETCGRCHGAKHLIQECNRCFGLGKIGSSAVCNHEEEVLPPAYRSGN